MKTLIHSTILLLVSIFLFLYLTQTGYSQTTNNLQKWNTFNSQKLSPYHSLISILKNRHERIDKLFIELALKSQKKNSNPDKVLSTEWLNYTLDSNWNTTNNNFDSVTQTYYAYDKKDNQKEILIKKFDGTNWVNDYHYFFLFDANNNIIEETDLSWNGTSWINDYHIVYSYDGNGNEISELHQIWNNSYWEDYGRIGFAYDASGNNIEAVTQLWEYQQWVNNTRYLMAYDENNNLTDELDQIWDGYGWANYYYYVYNMSGTNWNNWVIYAWYYTDWYYLEQLLFSYNTNNELSAVTYQAWNGQWINDYKYNFSYNSNGNNLETIEESWANGAWVKSFKTNYFYSAIRPEDVPTPIEQPVANLPKKVSLFQNYPNPFNPTTQIKFALPSRELVQLKVYDLTGKLVSTLIDEIESAGEHTITFHSNKLSSGMYIYQLKAGNKILSKKMLFIK